MRRLGTVLRGLRGWPLLALWALLAAGCQRPLRSDPRPYRLSHGLLEPEAALAPHHGSAVVREKQKAPRRKKSARLDPRRRSIVTRARALLGQTFSGPPAQARRALLVAALGPELPRWQQRGSLRQKPRPGDLVVFDQARDAASGVGIVVSSRGARVTFVYLCGARAREGLLDLRRPSLRRRRGRLVNSYVRVKTPQDRKGTRYLAGELLRGFLPPG